MSARKIGLLLLLLGGGAAVEIAWSVRNNLSIGPAGCRVLGGRFYGPSFSFASEQRKDVPAATRVEVENAFGSVRVVEGLAGEVRVALRKVVYMPTEEEARAFASRIELGLNLDGDSLRVTTNREQLEGRRSGREVGFETHLEVYVPARTVLKVRNEHGRLEVTGVAEADLSSSYEPVRVERIAGSAEIRSRHGNVAASDVGGALSVAARYGAVDIQGAHGAVTLEVTHGDVTAARVGSLRIDHKYGHFTAEEVAGDLEVRAQHAGVKASKVAGKTLIETSYRDVTLSQLTGDCQVKTAHGGVEAADLAGAISAEASYDDVTLSRIAGPVQVEVAHGGVKGASLRGGGRIRAAGDDVDVEGFQGPIDVESSRGAVRLVPEGALTDAVSVTTKRGGIRLEVPSESVFDLEASTTRRGEIQVAELPGLTIQESTPTRLLGRLGAGGKLVKLHAEHGDVSIAPRAAVASKAP